MPLIQRCSKKAGVHLKRPVTWWNWAEEQKLKWLTSLHFLKL